MGDKKSWTLNSNSWKEVIDDCEIHHKELINGNVAIHLVECGNSDGELVLLLHGFPNFWYVWKNQFKPLQDMGYHIVAPDLRGYNISSKPAQVINYGRSEVLSDIVCIIECFNAGKPTTVVGHDWGAIVALCLVEDFLNMVNRLVVVNGPHLEIMPKVLLTNIRQLFRSWYIFFIQLPWLPEWFFSRNRFVRLQRVLTEHGLSEEDVERYVQAWSVPGAFTGSINYYRAAFRQYWARKKTGVKVDIPVTVIWGELDKYLLPELANLPKDIFIKFSIVQCPKASHWPMWGEYHNFNNILLDALGKED